LSPEAVDVVVLLLQLMSLPSVLVVFVSITLPVNDDVRGRVEILDDVVVNAGSVTSQFGAAAFAAAAPVVDEDEDGHDSRRLSSWVVLVLVLVLWSTLGEAAAAVADVVVVVVVVTLLQQPSLPNSKLIGDGVAVRANAKRRLVALSACLRPRRGILMTAVFVVVLEVVVAPVVVGREAVFFFFFFLCLAEDGEDCLWLFDAYDDPSCPCSAIMNSSDGPVKTIRGQ